MITLPHVQHLARYNAWQNANLYGAADLLSDAERRRERGAFFGSIHGTLNHVLWGDRIWMHRFAGTPKPAGAIKDSPRHVEDWHDLKAQRSAFDATIIEWASTLDPAWLEDDLAWYSGAVGREMAKPRWLLVAHMFNHQTHHRGQAHCLLTQAGARPGATDLPFMPG